MQFEQGEIDPHKFAQHQAQYPEDKIDIIGSDFGLLERLSASILMISQQVQAQYGSSSCPTTILIKERMDSNMLTVDGIKALEATRNHHVHLPPRSSVHTLVLMYDKNKPGLLIICGNL